MVHQGSKYHSSFLALVSNMKEADVDVLNVERRLAPWFEYSHRRAAESGGKGFRARLFGDRSAWTDRLRQYIDVGEVTAHL